MALPALALLPALAPRVIMLSGWMKSGKDTVGEYLCRKHGFRRLAFADALKDEVAACYGVDRGTLDTQEGKAAAWDASGRTIRDLLIWHGQARRALDQDYWCHKVVGAIRSSGGGDIVITDWRFPNEHEALSRQCECAVVQTWRIQRWSRPPKTDSTELALDATAFDQTIRNTASVADLYAQIDAVLSGGNA